ncbi:inositol monophosphatase [Xinfangfangia sp. D13-10-4-6]|uniref:inositol monophosphatase family protein n=1 Tax=Pseudogemmobacter hezensis TaxID=2737662 RepID=UPI0015573284|nr:inositol monophosphatase [Pseudogemmobacter hezensis]NPD17268.1 inositol monophosphatase [Pseudogemmobacter hezensis]
MFDALEQITRAAGERALTYTTGRGFTVEAKGPLDLVTVADRDVEAFLLQALSEAFPEDGIIGEEGTSLRPGARRQWIIDPIDGTFNFVRGLPDWAVSIGLIEDGQPRAGAVFCPIRNRLLIGGRDEGARVNELKLPPAAPLDRATGLISFGFASTTPIARETAVIAGVLGDLRMGYRNGGSTAVALMQLAEGQIDAMLGLGNKAWDVAGGIGAVSGLGYHGTVDFTAAPPGAPIDFVFGKAEVVKAAAGLLTAGT